MTEHDNKVVIFKHSRSWSGDRCSQLLESMGYQIDWYYPHEGNPLPEPEAYRGAVIFGCRDSVNDTEDWIAEELRWVQSCLKTDCAFLGICFGGQLLAKVLGARVARHENNLTEVGFIELLPSESADSDFTTPLKLFQWHKEGFELPSNTTLLCSSDRFQNQAFQYNDRFYGLQFHPEVNHSVISQWFDTNNDYDSEGLDRASRARHLDYARQHDDAITEWFSEFLKKWLNE
ncbi:MAG: glutamine amidotransferase [Gammaproteobacteria bacterium]|nr:glutamine amidotransferase [Gammaproteobacteria bacterium]